MQKIVYVDSLFKVFIIWLDIGLSLSSHYLNKCGSIIKREGNEYWIGKIEKWICNGNFIKKNLQNIRYFVETSVWKIAWFTVFNAELLIFRF